MIAQSSSTTAATRSEAYIGSPFGVGRVTVDVLRGEPSLPLADERFTVLEDGGRVLYPVLKEEPVRRILRRLLDIETPRKVTIYYLFRGNEPFDLLPFTPVEQAVRVKPQADLSGHRRLLAEWWKEYSGRWQSLLADPQYPPIAENFLAANLARRLSLTLPESKRSILPWKKKETSVFDDLLASESHQLRVDREMLQPGSEAPPELQPLPEPIRWEEILLSEPGLEETNIEAIASHVPDECFYIRFGNFTNYLWFRDLNAKWQGDLGNMILRRGIDRGSTRRIEQQLAVRETALSKVLGPQVIADAAIIGLDPYVAQGAGIGILFQARNNFLLSNNFMQQRREALSQFTDAEESTVQIADRDVSLIATPDGRVRSYYVQVDDFHLVATSRTLVKRFIEAGQGERSLASLPGFLQARNELPVERDDTIFAFVSAKFFQNLCSPHYRIETQRRMQSAREPLLLELARLSAKAEGSPAVTTEELISAGMLPPGFAARPDGSQLLESKQGPLDSLRGAVGYFLPVGDMETVVASAGEVSAYHHFIERFHEDIGQLPPIAVGMKRIPDEGGDGESMIVDALAAPLDGLKLGSLAEALGEPSVQQLRAVSGDVVSVQAMLDLPVPLIGGEKQPHLLFGGLRDFRSPLAVKGGAIVPNAPRTELVRGYLGAWPRPGLLGMFVGSSRPLGNQPEQAGEELWQAQQEEFLLISFKPDVIEQVLPQLALEPAARPAQIRIRVDDLSDKQISETINAFGYMRARETSVAASRLMNALANQLHVPRDECRALAERLVDGQFVCPLGGEYQLFAPELSLETWSSTALPEQNQHLLAEVPDDFQLPILNWFRGLDGDLMLDGQSLSLHLEMKMTSEAVP